MNVLSLFDGISCARVALDRAGLPVGTYTACEIDPNAIKVSQRNYPETLRLGDVRTVKGFPVDLLIGGSPCQDLSIAKKGRKGLDGDRSGLFWEYVRILRESQPKWFILENVASMPKADRDTITRELGVDPILLDAALVSAQSRKRLFWTNIPGVTQPEDRGIVLADILQPEAEVDERMVVKGKAVHLTESAKSRALHKVGHVGPSDSQTNRVYSSDGKAPTQCRGPSGGATPTLILAPSGLQYVGHLEGGTRKGTEGQEHLSRAHAQSNRLYSPDGKSPTLAASETSGRTHIVVGLGTDPRIRKLTPTECERLQGLPDGYTEGVAVTNRYRCLGNAFNVDVVAHIVSHART